MDDGTEPLFDSVIEDLEEHESVARAFVEKLEHRLPRS